MNLELISSHLRDLSDRLRTVEAAANVAAAALLNDEPDKAASNAAEVLLLFVCEPLEAEIAKISRMAESAQKKTKGKSTESPKKPKKKAAN